MQHFSGLGTPDYSQHRAGSINSTVKMILAGSLIAVWGFSVYLRCSDAVIKRYLVAIATLLSLWLLNVIVKYSIHNDFLTSMGWYFYYVPILFTPTLCLFSALRAATLDQMSGVRGLKAVVVVFDVLLLLFVLSNNIHQGVFVFSFDDPHWQQNYTYAPGYWLVFAWCLLQFFTTFATLFVAAHKQLRSAFLPLLAIAILGITYGVFYALRVGGVVSSNFALTFSLIVAVALEACLDLGLLPSYGRYGEAFKKLPFDMKILSHDYQVVFSTDYSGSLTPEVRAMAKEAFSHGEESASFREEGKEDTLFRMLSIAGGAVLYTNEVSGIIERRKQLELKRDALRRRNLMLEGGREVQGRLYRQKVEGELFDELDSSLKAATVRIRDLLETLPSAEDEEGAAQRKAQLVMVKLLVAYCKRKGSLVLDRKSDPEFDRERLQLIVNETSADLRAAGVDCAAIVEVEKTLPSTTASILYDCLYDFALESLFYESPTLMFYIHEKDSSQVEMNAVMEKTVQSQGGCSQRMADLRKTLEQRNVAFRLEDEDCRTSLVVIASREEL